MVIGYSDSPNKGYDVEACIESIGRFLGDAARQEVALVGVGNLGRAVLAHFVAERSSVAIVAAFDVAPELTDTSIHCCCCFDVSRMGELVRDLGIEIAILTVPGEATQESADALVRAGVKSVISFAPVPLHLPNDIFVEYMDITSALESAAYFARLGGRETPEGNNGDGDIEPTVKKRETLLSRFKTKLEDLAQRIGAHIVTPGRREGTEVAKIYAVDLSTSSWMCPASASSTESGPTPRWSRWLRRTAPRPWSPRRSVRDLRANLPVCRRREPHLTRGTPELRHSQRRLQRRRRRLALPQAPLQAHRRRERRRVPPA
jgi:NADH/NAD ratio-sensing transcriptional regulator Rex